MPASWPLSDDKLEHISVHVKFNNDGYWVGTCKLGMGPKSADRKTWRQWMQWVLDAAAAADRNFHAYTRRTHMTSRTIIIELRVDYMDEEKHMLMKKVCGRAANKILSQAMLLQEKRPPQIAVHSNDYMHGTETIKAEDYENDE